MKQLTKQLREQIMKVEWDFLRKHQDRDAVVVVSQKLDLADCAATIALDKKEEVAEWLKEGLIYKPSNEQIEEWKNNSEQFDFLVIQPFVLIQQCHCIH